MFTWKRSIATASWPAREFDEAAEFQVDALKERFVRFCGGLVKGALAAVLYGSGSLVLSGVLFYFSWTLGIAALLVLGGLFPLVGSGYLLWRLMRQGEPPWLWRRRWRQVAILRLARRLGGQLTVADVVLGTGLSVAEAEATLNELARQRYVELRVSPAGVLVYHCFPLAQMREQTRRRAGAVIASREEGAIAP
jgi:hypothetical protein